MLYAPRIRTLSKFFLENLFNGSDHGLTRLGQVDLQKKTGWVTSQPVFASGQNIWVRVRYFSGSSRVKNSYSFCMSS